MSIPQHNSPSGNNGLKCLCQAPNRDEGGEGLRIAMSFREDNYGNNKVQSDNPYYLSLRSTYKNKSLEMSISPLNQSE